MAVLSGLIILGTSLATLGAPRVISNVRSDTFQLVEADSDFLRSKVFVRYTIVEGTIRELSFEISEGATPVRVKGDGIQDWHLARGPVGGPGRLHVAMTRDQQKALALEVELESPSKGTMAPIVSVPLLRPLGMVSESGVVAFVEDRALGFLDIQAPQYVQANAGVLPAELRYPVSGNVCQAYTHVGPPGPIKFRLGRPTPCAPFPEPKAGFGVHATLLYEVKASQATLTASLIVEVRHGRLTQLLLSLPKAASIGSINAPSLMHYRAVGEVSGAPDRQGYVLDFAQYMEQAFALELDVTLPLPSAPNNVLLPDVRVLEADVEEGSLGVVVEPGVTIQPMLVEGLRPADMSKLPAMIRYRSPLPLVLAYEYDRTPWSLDLALKRSPVTAPQAP